MNPHAKSLVKRYAEEVWNQRSLDVIDELFAPDHFYHDPLLGELVGTAGVREKCAAFWEGFPDGHVGCEELIAEGDLVALLWTYTATHTGDVLGMAATGRRARAQGVHLCRVAGGRIVETTVAWNGLNFLQQLGLAPELRAPATA